MGTPRLRLLYHWKGYALYWIFFSFSRCFLTTSPFLWPARILWCANVQVFFWCQVSVLDVDICGPSMPRIMGLEGEQVWHYQHSHCLSVYSAKRLVSVHLLMHFSKCMRIVSDLLLSMWPVSGFIMALQYILVCCKLLYLGIICAGSKLSLQLTVKLANALSVLTLLFWWQEEHPDCRNVAWTIQ